MLREFKTFVAVARGGTFTGAGRQLGLTQSAVSAQIRRLEAWLGAELFDRGAKSAELNAQGRELLPQIEALVAMAQGIVEQAAGPGRVSGRLRVGAIASAQQDLLVRALAYFRGDYPDVQVRLVPGVSLNLLGQVDAGEIDLAVMIRPSFALPAELSWQPLVREPMVLAAPRHAPRVAWRELLAGQPFIRYDRASFGGRLVDGFLKKQRIAVREAIELDEIDAIANLVRQGLGVALMPHTRQLDTRGLRLIGLDEPGFHREIGIVARRPLERAPLAAALVRCLVQAAR
ncbi:LysR family transcriptional regulator [Bordetella sp. FB-8]|uniref:LysR family transcriptional regulator n=1 Tax=Bordetella sp. FB-8 TaxID=1159870 RepID=UPI00037528AA|nr:LysR family transcriptional regulator [Bordetella sp. FB-8]